MDLNKNSERKSPTPSAPSSLADFAERTSAIFAKTLICLPCCVIASSKRFLLLDPVAVVSLLFLDHLGLDFEQLRLSVHQE